MRCESLGIRPGHSARVRGGTVVTSVLASYRGLDTLGEAIVVFTAGLGVWLLIGARSRDEDS